MFVLSACGSGIPVFRKLQKENKPFAAGILYKNDIDYQVARVLASEVVTEEPFREIGDRALERARTLMRQAKVVINAGVTIGACNQRMEVLLAEAEEMKHYVVYK